MKPIMKGVWIAGLSIGMASIVPAASMTMQGSVSDSMCGTSHAKMISGHPKMTERDCTLACVRAGAKYVFVSNGKVYKIANQNLADLSKNAGEKVSLTGDMNGDTITVTKVMMEKK